MNRLGTNITTLAGIAFLIVCWEESTYAYLDPGAENLLLQVCWEEPAYAYLDPGAGSLLLQVLMGGLAGAFVVVKIYWASLKARFGRGSKTVGPDHAETDV